MGCLCLVRIPGENKKANLVTVLYHELAQLPVLKRVQVASSRKAFFVKEGLALVGPAPELV